MKIIINAGLIVNRHQKVGRADQGKLKGKISSICHGKYLVVHSGYINIVLLLVVHHDTKHID